MTLGYLNGHTITNITIDTKLKQFRGFITDNSGNISIKFIDMSSDEGEQILDVIRDKDYALFTEICNEIY